MEMSATIDDDLDRLRSYISDHDAAGGGRLPPEPKLSEILGVTRGRLRTLLKRVESDGLIWRHVGKGTFTGAKSSANSRDGRSSEVSLDSLIAARAVLEPQLAAEAAIRATLSDVAALDSLCVDMRAATRFDAWSELDQRFHRKLAEATHNVLLLRLYDTIRAELRLNLDARVRQKFDDDPSKANLTNEQHEAIVAAVRAHNPEEAEDAMRRHLASVRTTLFGMR